MKEMEIKYSAQTVICVSVKHHGQILTANTNIIQNLQFYEHLPEILADLLNMLATTYDHVNSETTFSEKSQERRSTPKTIRDHVTSQGSSFDMRTINRDQS